MKVFLAVSITLNICQAIFFWLCMIGYVAANKEKKED